LQCFCKYSWLYFIRHIGLGGFSPTLSEEKSLSELSGFNCIRTESKFWIRLHYYSNQFYSCSCFGKNVELLLLFDSCSSTWNGLLKPQKHGFIHKIELWLLLRFFQKIATPNPLRRKTLNSDSTPAPVVDHLWYEQQWFSHAEKWYILLTL